MNTLELIQSYPIETDLEFPGIRTTEAFWIEAIRNCKTSIDIAQFYVSQDLDHPNLGTQPVGLQPVDNEPKDALANVIDALENAGNRGVVIRFMVSDALLGEHPATVRRLQSIKNLEFRILTLPFANENLAQKESDRGILHAKYWIFDSTDFFVGSQNFDYRALIHILELGIYIRSSTSNHPSLQNIIHLFERDWKAAISGCDRTFSGNNSDYCSLIGKSEIAHPVASNEKAEIELTASPPFLTLDLGIGSTLDRMITEIENAKSSIDIQLLSYHAYPLLDAALISAANGGVLIRIILSDWNIKSNEDQTHLLNLVRHHGIEIRISFVPKYSLKEVPYARVIHSKFIIFDQSLAMIGTSNFSKDYFECSRNIECWIRNREIIDTVTQMHRNLWGNAITKDVLTLLNDST